jgi:predicted GNAT superfamily acetyltransferase
LRTGHQAMGWTFDPMRGANAKLNLEKLGATVRDLTLDTYGVLRSSLYRNAPSDRFTAHWDLLLPRTHQRVASVASGNHRPPGQNDLDRIPEATQGNIHELVANEERQVRYRIPGDIDWLMERDPDRGVAWRNEMRTVLSALLTTKAVPAEGGAAPYDPIGIRYATRAGQYEARGFASLVGPDGERDSQYIIERMAAS